MSRKSSKAAVLGCALAFACAMLCVGPSSAQTTTSPYQTTVTRVAPPTLIAPVYEQSRPAPVVFQWNVGGSNGNVYGIGVQGVRRGLLAVATQTASYELQISDASPNAPDIGFSRVLVDALSTTTSYLFDDRNVPGSAFTNAIPPGLPLPAGRYFWRVRLEQPGAPFSNPGVFNLLSAASVQTPTHQLSVENLSIGARPAAQSATLVIATVANTGTFPEPPTDIRVVANGATIAQGRTPALAPNERANLVAAWIPTAAGISQLTATIDAAGDLPANGRFVRDFTIGTSRGVTTSLAGTIHRTTSGDFSLDDAAGHSLAIVIPTRGVDVASFVDRHVVARGSLTEGALGLQLNVSMIAAK